MSAIATTPLVPKQIHAIMQNVTLLAMGRTSPFSKADFQFARIAWQQQGQPFGTISEDFIFVRCVEDDDNYNRIRDVELIQDGPTQLIEQMTYTRVWRCFWVAYGPNSFDNMRIMRSALHRPSQPIVDMLATGNLYFVTDPAAPTYAPEQKDGQWWERTDFSAQFNEGVTEQEIVSAVASVEVIVETEKGVVADLEIPPSVPVTPLPPVSTADLTATSGTVVSSGAILEFSGEVTVISVNGGPIQTGDFGPVTIKTGQLASGDLVSGGTFQDIDSSVDIEITGFPLTYKGTLSASTWTLITLGNGQHHYTFSANLVSSQGTGALVAITIVIAGTWPGQLALASFNIHYN